MREQTQNRTIWHQIVRFCVCSALANVVGGPAAGGPTGEYAAA
jgi:hypothetical protein